MAIDYLFKGTSGSLIPQQKEEYLSNIQHTRLWHHYDAIDKLTDTLPSSSAAILVGLLMFGTDESYSDILDFAQVMHFDFVYNYFKIVSDANVLVQYMTDIDDPTYVFEGESAEASVLNGVQTTDSAYTGSFQDMTLQVSDAQAMSVLDMSNEPDETRKNEDSHMTANLGDFLSRPEIIQQFLWTPGGNFINANNFVYFSPFADYLNNPVIKRKIDNYRLFRCTGLKLQFRINGSPFHYGRLYAGWRPGAFNTLPYVGQENPLNTAIPPDNMAAFNTTTFPFYTHFSQWPGIFIDPATNEPQELIVPFMWNQNYMSLTSSQEFLTLGSICIWPLNPLRHANGSVSAISVTVTASIIDPVLSVPTNLLAFTGESDTKKKKKGKAGSGANQPSKPRTKQSSNDEYGKGIVSVPATALANFAGTLEKVPLIGPYATATKIAASKISDIAKLFGYSNPVNLSDINPMTIQPGSGLSCTTGTDASLKLTLDPKQEITIDPVVVGLQNIDEMTFAHLFKRESLLVQVPWLEATAPGLNLCHLAVGPWNKPTNNAQGILYHTALSWASFPFLWWRGSIKYRFQVVCSQNHRGRLAIVYNPTTIESLLPPQVATYQYFLDLDETKDMTVTVRHANPSAWLINNPPSSIFITNALHTFTDPIKVASNGFLSVYVVNDLGAPINTADVTINIFISAGDDFMVAGPGSPAFEKYTPYAPRLRDVFAAESDTITTGESMPMSINEVILNGDENDTPDIDNISSVFFGEQIVSLRALLKRYCFYTVHPLGILTPTELVRARVRHGLRPMSRGAPARGNEALGYFDGGGSEFNPVYNTYLDYYSRGFIAYRGSVRWKYNLAATSNMHTLGTLRARRFPRPLNANSRYQIQVASAVSATVADPLAGRIQTYLDSGAPEESYTGTALAYVRTKNMIEFEHPFYSTQRFHFMAKDTANVTSSAAPNAIYYGQSLVEVRETHEVDVLMPAAANNATTVFETYCAAGEDFSLHYFIGAPVVGFCNFVA